ncbi:MAG: metallo-beta-lactamase family protein [Flavobacteriaceae bacterium]|jgi:metallo-beta-lactamase family protein
MKKLTITFAGGAGAVTGANFHFNDGEQQYIVDCGMAQGIADTDERNWEPFPYDAKQAKTLFITHAHTDHIGRIPKIVHDGFSGRIISTPATRDIARIMLEDTARLLKNGCEDRGQAFLIDMYSRATIDRAFELWDVREYHDVFSVGDMQVKFLDAGHILGSAMVKLSYGDTNILCTGDLGNSPSPLLRDTEKVEDIDYMLIETVYGNRNHEDTKERYNKLKHFLVENEKNKGVLMMPLFSLERTQEILFEINTMIEKGELAPIDIYLDSPLSIKLTEIYRSYGRYFNESAQKILKTDRDGDLFDFPGLAQTMKSVESKQILYDKPPKVIMAGSGMSSGGRIIHHEKAYLSDSNNTLLMMGYQAVGTMGRLLEEGVSSVEIHHATIPVRAKIDKIDGYSGHKDMDRLLEFVEDSEKRLKKVFCVLGEPKASLFFAQRVRDYLNVKSYVPEHAEVIEIEI